MNLQRLVCDLATDPALYYCLGCLTLGARWVRQDAALIAAWLRGRA